MTILSNLREKGIVKRHRQGRAYIYTPAFSREDFTRAGIVEIVDDVLRRFTDTAMTHLVDRMAKVDPKRLAELEEAYNLRQATRLEPNFGNLPSASFELLVTSTVVCRL
jgi:predicted transcriptional regulator